MNKAVVFSSNLKGLVTAPSSKSYAQRAAVLALLKKGKTVLHHYGNSNDEEAVLQAIQQFGAIVHYTKDCVVIASDFEKNTKGSKEIGVGESGLGLRLLTYVAALCHEKVIVKGAGSLLNRPHYFFDEVLPKLNVQFQSNAGKLPFEIQGAIQLQNVEIDGSMSSQFISGLLIAYSYLFGKTKPLQPITITVHDLKSKPYVDVTLNALKQLGCIVPTNINYEKFVFEQPQQSITAESYVVEGDWSSIATLLVAAAIAGQVTIKNVNIHSKQADIKIVEVLQQCGCNIMITEDEITLSKPFESLKNFDFDATDCPDLFPILVALATYCKGTSTIKGVRRLVHKESNRGWVLQNEFKKIGVNIDIDDDVMHITNPEKIISNTIHSHNDHRIAFAGVLIGLQSTEGITVTGVEAINKSYKNFINDLKSIGANILIQD